MSRIKRGLLIAFEGLDRSGKSTQAQILHSYFHKLDRLSLLIKFPVRTTETGKQIDEYLKGKREYNHEKIHNLFALNRWEMKDEIVQNIENGNHVILDRYAYSGVAYSVAKGLDLEWCKKQDEGLPKPDFVFYLSLTPEEAMLREGYGQEVFEKRDFQAKVKESYAQLFGKEWIIVSANRNKEMIHQEIISNLNKNIESHPNLFQPLKKLWINY